MPSPRRILTRLLALLGALLVAAIVFVNFWIAPTGTGYVAKLMCSGVFVSGLDPARVKAEDLRPQWFVSAEVDHDARAARSTLFGMAPRTAVYRDGLGCSLTIGTSAEALRAATPSAPPPPVRPEATWPVGEARPETIDPGIDRTALDAAVDDIFAERDPDKPLWTRAVVVVHKGQLVAERYAEGIDERTPLLGWSMTKSVSAALVGVLVREGRLDVHAPAPVPAWRGEADPRAAITLDQLMRMSSGLEFAEVYGPLADATAMLFESHDTAALPMSKPLAVAPDSAWSYSSGTSNLIAWIVRQEVEKDGGWPAYATFPRRALFDPVGMRTAVMEPDPSGTFIGSSFCYASARDWARFGLLHLQDGVWEGRRILPEGWVAYVSTPTPKAPRGEYGAQWWTNRGAPEGSADRRFPSAPVDLYQASGFQGQSVAVIPSREAVIVRLGMTHDRSVLDLDGFYARVLAALPES